MQSVSAPPLVDVIIPAHDQAGTLTQTLAGLPHRLVRSAVVVDTGSTDSTAAVARDAGAVVLRAPRVGYGAACRRAIHHLETLPRPPDVAVFMAPDGTDDPQELPSLLAPICDDNAELVIGVRRGRPPRTPQNRLMLGMIGAIYRHHFDDLSPFRAIRFPALVALALSDPSPAFHIEMQVKAIKFGLHIAEVPVHTRAPRTRPSLTRAASSVKTVGRSVFHILRHSTTR